MPSTASSPPLDSARAARVRAPWRVVLASSVAFLGLAISALVMWDQDLKYSLPTPIPERLESPAVGADVLADDRLVALRPHLRGRPLLVHVFGASCPCSWFNSEHVLNLKRTFGDRIDFVALVECPDGAAGLEALADHDLCMPAVADVDGNAAHALGVYATPQAVLLGADGRLYYRGNYNLARYCIDPRTEFARLAIESLLADDPPPEPRAAGPAYGCSLPSDLNPTPPR